MKRRTSLARCIRPERAQGDLEPNYLAVMHLRAASFSLNVAARLGSAGQFRPAPRKENYLTVMVLVDVLPPALETTVTKCGNGTPVNVMV